MPYKLDSTTLIHDNAHISANSASFTGRFTVDTDLIIADNINDRVGIKKTPSVMFDVNGTINAALYGGAGVAANSIDNTATRLVTQGYFGLGSHTPPLTSFYNVVTSIDSSLPTGFWRTDGPTSNGTFPSANYYGYLLAHQHNASDQFQIWTDQISTEMYARRYRALQGGWQPWIRIVDNVLADSKYATINDSIFSGDSNFQLGSIYNVNFISVNYISSNTSDLNTGISFQALPDSIAFVTGGVTRARINNGGIDFQENPIYNVGEIQLDSIAGELDTDTKITFPGSDVIGFEAGAATRARINTTGLNMFGHVLQNASQVQSTSIMGIIETDTYISFPGSDLITFYSGGSEKFRTNSLGIDMQQNQIRNASTVIANVFSDSLTTATFLDLRAGIAFYIGNTLRSSLSNTQLDIRGGIRANTWAGTVNSTGTGHVIERGVNANGEYIRLADGTQFCISNNRIFHYSTADSLINTWSYPASFVAGYTMPYRGWIPPNTDAGNFNGISPSDVGIFRGGAGIAATAMNIQRAYGAPNFVAGDNVSNVVTFAIGRWF